MTLYLKGITGKSATRGFIAFMTILLMMPLGHAFVVLMERNLTGTALNTCAFFLGLFGIVIAVAGNRCKGEAMRVLAGAFGAILFWGAWVEFVYISYSRSMNVAPLMLNGEIYTKPQYLMLPSSLAFAALSFIMYVYMADTKWGVVVGLRRWLGIDSSLLKRGTGESLQAFIDMVLLIWWAYLILLVEFDPSLCGARHPVTMITSTVCLVCGLILFVRQLGSSTWSSALRQSIVTVCVLWTYIEVMLKLKLFTEIWIYPEKYVVETILMIVAFVAFIWIMAFMGHKNIRKKRE